MAANTNQTLVPPRTTNPIELMLFIEQLCRWANSFNPSGDGILSPTFAGITISSDGKLVFRDSAIYIQSLNDGYLDLFADIATRINDGLIVNGLTASKPVWTDANKKLVSRDIKLCDVVQTHLVATTQTVTTGTLTSGVVADTQVWADGNSVHITEVTGVPGYDVRYVFASVADFCAFGISAYYIGTGSHYCEFQIYDADGAAWKALYNFNGGAGFNYRYSDFPDRANVANYINGLGEVRVRFYHPSGGNASHDLYIDYVSIIGSAVL